jgi:hypothetical protein
MQDPADQLIRRALARRPPPTPGPAFVEDVLRSVATGEPLVDGPGARVRRGLAAAVWILAAAASTAVLASMEWSSASRTVAWGFGLLLVPTAYSVTLCPGAFAALLATFGGAVAEEAPRFARRPAVRGRG